MRVTVKIPKPDPKPEVPKVWVPSTRCKSKWAVKGRTDGMPWNGTSPISVSTEIDARKTSPRTDLGLGLWNVKMGLKK
jgi:hypothetical protein